MGDKKFIIGTEDLKAWKQFSETVEKVDSNIHTETKPLPKLNAEASTNSIKTNSVALGVLHKKLEMANSKDIDKNLVKKMDAGTLPIEGKLDLHGKNIAEAHAEVLNFILSAFNSGKRLLLIITGKGVKSPEGRSVLRDELPNWLNDKRIAGMILRFNYANRKHGGHGAFYVLIRRRRNR